MKVVILAGGDGMALPNDGRARPKSLVEIGNRPILWHIMKLYSAYGLDDFVVCCGANGPLIKDYFARYALYTSDVTIDVARSRLQLHGAEIESWRVTLIDGGTAEATGGHLRQARRWIDGTFCLTYGDGIGDIDIPDLIRFHRAEGALATVTAVRRPAGTLSITAGHGRVTARPSGGARDAGRISGGFFVMEPSALDYIVNDTLNFEREPLQLLTANNGLAAYRHEGFWHHLATPQDRDLLDRLWRAGNAPWHVWRDSRLPAALCPQSEIVVGRRLEMTPR
jgi:glucose-1-phosphate cytidylyltransferase